MPRPLPADVRAATGGDTASVRAYILDAAGAVIDKAGLAGATTRAIAAEAGLAGGTLYNYFDDHTGLVAKAIVHRAGTLADPVADLASRAGQGSLTENLRVFVAAAGRVLDQILPLVAASFADPGLLDAVRREMAAVEPLADPVRVLERYLAAELALGRLAPDADVHAAALVVVGLCHDNAFQRHLGGRGGPSSLRDQELNLIVHALTTPGTNPSARRPSQ